MQYGSYYSYHYNRAVLADGQEYLFFDEDKYILGTERDIYDEDWKTALVHGNPCIPKGTKVELEKVVRNFYGTYFLIQYAGRLFYANPKHFTYIGKREA